MTYSEKLKDPRWQKKRLEILEASGWKCNGHCQNEKPNPTLHVHHRIYLRGLNPWEYEPWAYHVLCDECHGVEQEIMQEAYRALARFPDLMCAVAALDRMDEKLASMISGDLLNLFIKRPEFHLSTAQALQWLAQYQLDLFGVGANIGRESP
jgi:hypothetical protein